MWDKLQKNYTTLILKQIFIILKELIYQFSVQDTIPGVHDQHYFANRRSIVESFKPKLVCLMVILEERTVIFCTPVIQMHFLKNVNAGEIILKVNQGHDKRLVGECSQFFTGRLVRVPASQQESQIRSTELLCVEATTVFHSTRTKQISKIMKFYKTKSFCMTGCRLPQKVTHSLSSLHRRQDTHRFRGYLQSIPETRQCRPRRQKLRHQGQGGRKQQQSGTRSMKSQPC